MRAALYVCSYRGNISHPQLIMILLLKITTNYFTRKREGNDTLGEPTRGGVNKRRTRSVMGTIGNGRNSNTSPMEHTNKRRVETSQVSVRGVGLLSSKYRSCNQDPHLNILGALILTSRHEPTPEGILGSLM